MTVNFIDNSAEVLAALETQSKAALEAAGQQCASHAKSTVAAAERVDTGTMRDSINHLVQEKTAYVGTNTNYAIYHELGTGVHIPGGRKTPWAFLGADGERHWTRGIRPIHMIKNSVANHKKEILAIITKYLKGLGS